MTPATYDITIYQGATWTKTFVISSGSLDFTDYEEIRMQIRPTPNSPTLLWGTSSPTYNATTLTIVIPASATDDFNFSSAGYDIEGQKADGTVHKFFRGAVTVIKEYTR